MFKQLKNLSSDHNKIHVLFCIKIELKIFFNYYYKCKETNR